MTTNPNDAAFESDNTRGCSKRELFAAMAMQGLANNMNHYMGNEAIAKESVAIADALIEVLNEGKQSQGEPK